MVHRCQSEGLRQSCTVGSLGTWIPASAGSLQQEGPCASDLHLNRVMGYALLNDWTSQVALSTSHESGDSS